jgi:hypothetical protein
MKLDTVQQPQYTKYLYLYITHGFILLVYLRFFKCTGYIVSMRNDAEKEDVAT